MPAAVPIIAAAATKVAVAKLVATVALSLALGSYQQSRARKKARAAEQAQRDAYNASLKDRHITIRSGVSTRKYVLGRVRVGGTLMHIEANGKDNTALDSVLAMAGNQCVLDGYYLGDEFLSIAEFPGDQYGKRQQIDQRIAWKQYLVDADRYATIVLPSEPIEGSVSVTGKYSFTVNGATVRVYVPYEGVFQPNTVTLSVFYKTWSAAKLRVIYRDGSPNQAPSSWPDISTPLWTDAHLLRGVAYLRTLNLWDEDIYHSGAPQMGAVLKGGWVDGHSFFDPRTGTNPTHTTNPAILSAWYMTLPRNRGGMGIPDSWIDWPHVSLAANICDELIRVRALEGEGYDSIKRYECNTLLDTANPPIENLNIIMSSMAGEYVFTAGMYRIFAGAFRPATVTITDDDVVGNQDIIMDKSGQDDAPSNIVTSTFINANRNWLESSPRPIRNAAYIASDGAESPLDLPLPATTDERQAAYIMGVMLESARPAFAGEIPVLGIGEDLAVMDTVQLNLSNRPEYAGKTFQIVNRIDNWDGTFSLTLQETRANVWSLDPDTFLPTDPTPVTDTSYLWNVAPITNFQIDAHKPQALSDGTAVVRTDLTWDLHPQPYVREGGRIELRYREATEGPWISIPSTAGDATGTSFTAALVDGAVYQFQARAVNGVGAVSNWTDGWEDYDGVIGAPPALTSLTTAGVVAGIDLAWTFPGTNNAIRHTETRYSLNSEFDSSVLMGDFAWPTNRHSLLGLAHGAQLWFWGRLVDENGTPGPWYPGANETGVYGQSSTDANAINGYITKEILESALGQQMWSDIEAIPEIQAKLDEISGAGQHDPAQPYLSGSVVFDSGKMYRALQDVPADTPITDMAYWQHIGDYASIQGAIAALSLQTQENTQLIEDIDGVVTATATATSIMQAAMRDDDDGEGDLAGVLNEYASRAWISELRRTQVTETQVEAIVQQQVGVELGEVSVIVEDISRAVTDIEGVFNATQSTKIGVDVNGVMYTAGYGLGLSNETGVVQSQFVVISDRFAVMHAPNGTPIAVFTVDGGVISMNTALIGDATIGTLKLAEWIRSTTMVSGQPVMEWNTRTGQQTTRARDGDWLVVRNGKGSYVQYVPTGVWVVEDGVFGGYNG
ncbi:DUF1983 domain-containing protein [Paenalcaligenes niemegkensis]|uniref:phage tail tip fiber protein n=1 Tax=Paenalcaligenes niemegkensis TaxID=2895469 RepID=UPI001EE79733|nr:DUF1983 domain-containing protein [Paenalcaligenes niemegkensis]MCQ9615947.1 DUF1983 domain-containing protein [Paenalcaligenes niemegkensis]